LQPYGCTKSARRLCKSPMANIYPRTKARALSFAMSIMVGTSGIESHRNPAVDLMVIPGRVST